MEDILTVCIAASLCYDIFSAANTTMCQNGTQLPNLEDTTQIIKSINTTLSTGMNFPLREELWGGHLHCSLDMARNVWKILVMADKVKWTHLICTSVNSAIAQPSSSSWAWLWIMLVLLTLGVSLGCVMIYINKIRHKAAPKENNDNNK
jgi:hypothetical protein